MKKRLNSFHFILDTVSAKPVAQGLERLSMPPTGAAMIKPGV